jgi:hypothetical protein
MRITAGGIELSKDIFKELLSRRVLSVLALMAIIFLTSGGVYVVVEGPGSMVSTSSGGTSFISRSSSSQTSVELIVTFFLTLGGSVGFILLEGALKKTFDPSGARVKYVLAITLIILTLVLLEYLAYAKVG